ncbi:sensor histidine kinase [Arthrobacter bambusae]|uniref:sensor histidine kinase n=1 Tax=Arthrobacter bambusae TaxID=1338426 RepID=UPI002780E987|nr:histidine kinase [Arthrobacter bambusae]MDQ0030039.1 signal transduction histidine kinase [Arthrobacter bambusae]MDQ0097442.1 signal transduction histidine kinase [Arthrobacter bambusae]
MEQTLKVARQWGAPAAAVIFFALWCVAEAGRMAPWIAHWSETWTFILPRFAILILTTFAIAVSAWRPVLSLGFTAVLLTGQLVYFIPQPYSDDWPIYLGSFVGLGFSMWTARGRLPYVVAGSNFVFAGVMTFIMLSWRYGGGIGWFRQLFMGDRYALANYGWQLFSLLLLIAASCAAVGIALRLYEERRNLFKAKVLVQANLKETEVELVVEQERTRIARDLHDVLAHSLAVIAAQADGTRYLSQDQPKAVLDALQNIAVSARHALVDAQRVIEGVRDDGLVAPQPRLTDVGPLLERMRQGSLKIEQSETGTPVELGAGQQLAVFRIVQECLTNALKHGGRGTAVRLHFDWSGPGLTMHVASELPPSVSIGDTHDGGAAERVGRGIPGMRERAHLAGGWLSSGPDGEQFRVTVFIPYGSRPAPLLPEGGSEREAVPPGKEAEREPALALKGASPSSVPEQASAGRG